jgi:hypothetical protein
MNAAPSRSIMSLVLLTVFVFPVCAADLATLSPRTWDRYVPEGKEVDAIFGDFALVNDQIMCVIAQPRKGRHANMTVRDVGGCMIDLTRRDCQSDQLSAFYPGGETRALKFAGVLVESPTIYEADDLERVFVRARSLTLRLVAAPSWSGRGPDVEVSYTLGDGWPYVLVTTQFTNRGPKPVEEDLLDMIRADGPFESAGEAPVDLFWAYDRHFGQAYGLLAEGHRIKALTARHMLVRYVRDDRKMTVSLAPGETYRLSRRIFPGAHHFQVRQIANQLAGTKAHPLQITVKSLAGQAISGADVTLNRRGKRECSGRTDERGQLTLDSGDEPGSILVSSIGHGTKEVLLTPPAPESLLVRMAESAEVAARITDEQGGSIPCKVQFIGARGTASPDFGPDTGEHAVKNVVYSHDGRFTRTLEPGSYNVIISHGPEYDAVFTKVDVDHGKATILEAKLIHTVHTDGWISTDFHSHASPSGDNTSSQLGRVLNLLCEHIEFAPCTEHNRLSTYDGHLSRLGAGNRMATCVGMELTGNPLPLNHQNAFPLVLVPHTPDNGAPTPDSDPELQIERLALWDASSDKLVQVNHPDIGWMFRDRDGNRLPDTGFDEMHGRMDVIEVHPPDTIFGKPASEKNRPPQNNTIVNWLQLLNNGYRIPGVVNTDAHYNFHGSGWLRNYVKSPTDDPAQVKTMDVVHAAERGNIVMTSGPYLEVKLKATGGAVEAIPGENLSAPGGALTLKVRVQCPNWFDVDRVQVFVNGRPGHADNFTRKSTPAKFSMGVVKFDQEIAMQLHRDAHVIVAAIGEKSGLGPVMGPEHASDRPVAVSNPIFVDINGDGFKHNGDPLGDLPVKRSN